MRIANLLLIILLAIFSGCTSVEETDNHLFGDEDAMESEKDITEKETDNLDGDEDLEIELEIEQDLVEEDLVEEDLELEIDEAELDAEPEYESEVELFNEADFEDDSNITTCTTVESASPIKTIASIAHAGNTVAVTLNSMNSVSSYSSEVVVFDKTDSTIPPAKLESKVTRVMQAPHEFFATLTTSNHLLIYETENLNPTSEPINEIYCPDCDFNYMCFTGERIYWLSTVNEEHQRRVMAGRLDENGQLIYGTESDWFVAENTGTFMRTVFLHLHLLCTPNYLLLHSYFGDSFASSAGYSLSYYSTSSENHIGEKTLLSGASGGAPNFASLPSNSLFTNGDTLITNLHLFVGSVPMMPPYEMIDKSIYNLTNPDEFEPIQEHELSLSNWRAYQNDSVWTVDNLQTLNRFKFTEEYTLEEIESFEAESAITHLAVDKDTAYMGLRSYGVQVAEITENSTVEELFSHRLIMSSDPVMHIIPHDEKMFIVNDYHYLSQYDSDNPLDISYKVDLEQKPLQVIKQDNLVYAMGTENNKFLLSIVDLSKPADEALLSSGQMPFNLPSQYNYSVPSIVDGNMLYLAKGYLYGMNVSNPHTPTVSFELNPKTLTDDQRFSYIYDIITLENYLVLLCNDTMSNEYNSLVFLEKNQNAAPTYLASFDNIAEKIVRNDTNIITAVFEDNHLVMRTVDLSDPMDPRISIPVHRYDIERFNVLSSIFFEIIDGYLVISAENIHIINPEDLSKDVYTIETDFPLLDIKSAGQDEPDTFWIALNGQPAGFLKTTFLDDCKP